MVPPQATTRRRLLLTARIALLLGVVAVSVLSLIPSDELPEVTLSDKIQHGLAYMALAAVGVAAFADRTARLSIAAGLFVLGMVLEALQRFVPGRYFDVWDMVANGAGVVLGYVVMLIVMSRVSGPKAEPS
jgi:VanZ family protein